MARKQRITDPLLPIVAPIWPSEVDFTYQVILGCGSRELQAWIRLHASYTYLNLRESLEERGN